MRIKSAQSELKDKEKSSKNSGQAYSKDKAAHEAIQKEIARIEVRTYVCRYIKCGESSM